MSLPTPHHLQTDLVWEKARYKQLTPSFSFAHSNLVEQTTVAHPTASTTGNFYNGVPSGHAQNAERA
jgi:hypothetical protein